MFFIVASLIVAIAGSMVTIKTLVGYNQFSLWFKLSVAGLVVVGWLAPILTHFLRRGSEFLGVTFPYIYNLLYLLFGLAFILLILILVRDFIWVGGWKLSRLWTASPFLDPYNPRLIARANLGVVLLSLAVCTWAVWEAVKIPDVKTVSFSSEKLDREYRLAMLSDLHINRTSSLSRLNDIVAKVNALKPEAIFLVGDVVDDKTKSLEPQMQVLRKLSAPLGVYIVTGNHELYSGLDLWLRNFRRMGWNVLINQGQKLKGTKLYVGGVPDLNTAMSPFFKLDFARTFKGSRKNDYKILLSHYPNLEKYGPADYDLQLSGHTHGGQIFPFHYLSWKANKYLAGAYRVDNHDLYVSRGTGYWGPPLRLFAPSEITEIILQPSKK